MRLLQLLGEEITLTENFIDDPPPYAILSHTWGSDSEEVTYQELIGRSGKNKAGYKKILFCGQQAKKDGLEYFWVDTCCIDKTSSAELNEAINSMFRWYKFAKSCYVYLADVSHDGGSGTARADNSMGTDKLSQSERKAAFRESRWFTRGWTLQELIAPANLHFFDSNWISLGDKSKLVEEIVHITGIQKAFLTGTIPLHAASVAQRMSWAAKRTTTRKEDMAYCLLGLFNISMALIYGEDDGAFRRLQEEIMRKVDDDTILAWGFMQGPPLYKILNGTPREALANSPSDFESCGSIVRGKRNGDHLSHMQMLSGALQVQSTLYEDDSGQNFIILACRSEHEMSKPIAIPIQNRTTGNLGNQQITLEGYPQTLRSTSPIKLKAELVLLRLDHFITDAYVDQANCLFIDNPFKQKLKLVETRPRTCWMPDTQSIKLNSTDTAPYLTLLRFRHIEENSLDFIVVLNSKQRDSYHEANHFVMVSSRKTTLTEIIECYGDIECLVTAMNYANNGVLDLHVCMALERLGTRTMFGIKFESCNTKHNTINITNILLGRDLCGWLFNILQMSHNSCLGRRGSNIQVNTGDRMPQDSVMFQEIIDFKLYQFEGGRLISETLEILHDGDKFNPKTTDIDHQQQEILYAMQKSWLQVKCLSFDQNSSCTVIDYFYIYLLRKVSNMMVPVGDFDIDFNAEISRQVVMAAAYYGNEILYDFLRGIIIRGNEKHADDCISLRKAAFGGNSNIVSNIMYKGPYTECRDSGGRTALSIAASRGHESIVALLIGSGADIESRDDSGWSPLSYACYEGHGGVAALLLKNGANIESKTDHGWSPLAFSAWRGHKTLVCALLQSHADIESRTGDGRSPLLIAAGFGHEATVGLLLEQGADIESADYDGWSPLAYACHNNHEAVVQLLLDRGANIESKSKKGRSPLAVAAYCGHEAVTHLLVERQANLESMTDDGRTPLAIAASNGRIRIVCLLLSKGADAEAKRNSSWSTLTYAAIQGHEAIAQMQIEAGADIESKILDGLSPLALATRFGHVGVTRLLLEKGANKESRDKDNRSLLALAARNGHRAVAQLLLEYEANIEAKDTDQQSPLVIAIRSGHQEVFELLLRHGADIESKSKYGRPPLAVATQFGRKVMARLLLEQGANIKSADDDGWSPLTYACYNGHEGVVQLLLDKGANIESKCRNGRSPLAFAAYHGHKLVAGLLLKRGANIESKDKDGRSPLALAARRGHKTLVQLLLEHRADITSRDRGNRSPEVLALRNGHEAVVRLLYEARK